jgi:transposase
MSFNGAPVMAAAVVAVDAGKNTAVLSVTDSARHRLSEQRRVQGRRRVKTDAIDLEAITELVLAGHGVPVTARSATITELSGWAMHRSRRIWTRTATKNQLLAQLDRCFRG